ncbi:MAG: chemotaxis protein CheA [Desulfobacterales bacterium]|nr:chemotaxis protein CheA [Desulfobacterales bacterium]
MDNLKEIFRQEAYELFTELEECVLELEKNPDDTSQVGHIFRLLHTIKGSGGMAGFDEISEFAHEIETAFDLVREGKMAVSKELINLTLSARDQMQAMLDISDDSEAAETSGTEKIIKAFSEIRGTEYEADNTEPEQDVPEHKENDLDSDVSRLIITKPSLQNITYRIRFRPAINIFANGTNPVLLLKELTTMGHCIIVSQINAIPRLEHLNPEACYIYWDIILTTQGGINAVRDVFIFVEDISDISFEVIDDEGLLEDDTDYKRLGEILLERKDLSCDELIKTLSEQKKLGEKLIENKILDQGIVESALAEQEYIKEIRKKRREVTLASSVRVSADKLDALVNLVGELVTLQARFGMEVSLDEDSEHRNPAFVSISEELDRLTGNLRDTTMGIRMLPVDSTFNSLKRLVRDLSLELGKEVDMVTEGRDTELDKTVIERLNDPLVHIIRNCIDHGIEMPEVREEIGKPGYGTICLKAEHSGANVLISISDDGAGLDPLKIRARAVEKGILSADAELSDKEILYQIFAPGFSTSKEVTEVSGRGVGMDVVRRSIETLGGSVEIDSKKSVGTTIILKLPLTLAIIDGLLVKVGEGCFVFPLSVVEECVNMVREDMEVAQRRNMIKIRGKILPFLSLRELFMVSGEHPDNERIVIASAKNRKMGLGVDCVIGQHQTVIKSLGRIYRNIKGITGATILGDGSVALILDVAQLVQSVKVET